MNEPEVSIEVVSIKRGRCIRCPRPGRKRRVKARCGHVSSKFCAILCLPCAKQVGITLKYEALVVNRPSTYAGIIEVGLLAQEQY